MTATSVSAGQLPAPDLDAKPLVPDFLNRAVTFLGLLYIATTPWESLETVVGTPTSATGMLFLAAWSFAWMTGRISTRLSNPARVVMAMLVVWTMLTTFWSVAQPLTLSISVSTLGLVLSALAIAQVFRDDAKTAILAMALGTLPLALAVIAGAEQIALNGRATVAAIDTNIAAFTLSLGLGAAIYVALTQGFESRQRMIASASTLPTMIAILMTGSRTGLITVIVLAVVALILSLRSFGSFLLVATTLFAELIAFHLLRDLGLLPERLARYLETFAAPGDDRELIIDAFRVSQDAWVLLGVGAGADAEYLRIATGWYRNAHNMLWKTWIELGIVGVIIWMAVIVLVAVLAWRSEFRTFFVLMAAPIALFAYSLSTVRSNSMWVVIGLALIAGLTPKSNDPSTSDPSPPVGHSVVGSR